MRRLTRGVARGLAAVAAIALGTAAPAGADMTEPVYLVHGYSKSSVDCEDKWGPAKDAWEAAGWEGELIAVGYYAGDVCDVPVTRGDRDTKLQDVGRALAWEIYNRYSSKGVPVDVVGHSMGGLIARVALAKVGKEEDFPPFLLVEDAVTLGTPHAGVTAGWVRDCNDKYNQCIQMTPGSTFLKRLAVIGENPQMRGGTDWTLIGSVDDHTVAWRSAVPPLRTGIMRPDHRIIYRDGISHSELRSELDGDRTYRLIYCNDRGGCATPWKSTSNGRAPVYAAGGAIKHSEAW